MTALVFPDDRALDLTGPGRVKMIVTPGTAVPVYTDPDGTTAAVITAHPDYADSVLGSTVLVDGYGRLPLFYGPSGVDTLWVSVEDGPIVPIYARTDDRIDAMATGLAAFQATVRIDVAHGNDTAFPRPVTPYPVHWIGFVDPANAVTMDSRDKIVLGIPPGEPLPAPTGLRAAAGNTTATLVWTDPVLGATGIRIYKNGILVDSIATGVQSWSEEGLTNGTRYSYAISAIDGTGRESPLTDSVVAAPTVLDQAGLLCHLRFDTAALIAADSVGSVTSSDANLWTFPVFASGGTTPATLPLVRDIGGLVGLRLNADCYLDLDIPDQGASQASIYLLVRPEAVSATTGYFATNSSATNDSFQVGQNGTGADEVAAGLTSFRRTIRAVITAQPELLEVHWTPTGVLAYRNGVESTGIPDAGGSLVAQTVTTVRRLKLGATRGSLNATAKVTIGEAALYVLPGGHDSAMRAATRARIASRWGVTVV